MTWRPYCGTELWVSDESNQITMWIYKKGRTTDSNNPNVDHIIIETFKLYLHWWRYIYKWDLPWWTDWMRRLLSNQRTGLGLKSLQSRSNRKRKRIFSKKNITSRPKLHIWTPIQNLASKRWEITWEMVRYWVNSCPTLTVIQLWTLLAHVLLSPLKVMRSLHWRLCACLHSFAVVKVDDSFC